MAWMSVCACAAHQSAFQAMLVALPRKCHSPATQLFGGRRRVPWRCGRRCTAFTPWMLW